MSTLAVADQQYDILAALRKLQGHATVGDVVAATGLAPDHVESGLKALLESHRGHLAVTDSGELLYQFDARLIQTNKSIVKTTYPTTRAGQTHENPKSLKAGINKPNAYNAAEPATPIQPYSLISKLLLKRDKMPKQFRSANPKW